MQTHGDKGGSFDLLKDEIKEEDEHSQESGADNKSSSRTDAGFEIDAIKRVNTDHNLYFGKYHKLIDDKVPHSPKSARPT